MADQSTINKENDLFYFETDHVALRGNKDYSDLLKTITILEAQRAAAIQDIDQIIEIQKNALEDPVSFAEKIKNNEDIGIPIPQEVAQVPEINWSKYDIPISDEIIKSLDSEKSELKHNVVVKEAKKPKTKDVSETYNQPWTAEEQKKLEELLVKFPPEPIEMRRYKKIAEALGNRTVKQVTSRCQKYFKKLYNAGLPVPGRIPKSVDRRKAFSHRHQRNNFYLYKPSTFFPDMDVPVVMNEGEDDIPQSSTHLSIISENTMNNSNKKELTEQDELQLKINILKQIKLEKIRENKGHKFTHEGYKCDICNEEPITGSRWHCFDCKQDSVDFCTDCMLSQFNSPSSHPLTHQLIPLQNNENPDIPTKPIINLAQPSTSYQNDEKIEDQSSESDEDDEEDDDEEDDDDDDDDEQEDSLSSVSTTVKQKFYDKDYDPEYFMNTVGKYNYLDPNFLPE